MEGCRAVVGVLLVKVSSYKSGLGRLVDFGESRAKKRRVDSFPESGTGVIGIGVSVHLDGGILCGHPDTLMIPLTIRRHAGDTPYRHITTNHRRVVTG
jgi:hypothetical protein